MTRLLAIDLGTSSTKAVLYDADGTTVRRAHAEHRLASPRPGWAEADPEGWWTTVVTAVRAALAGEGGDVGSIGLSGQMHGVVLCRADGRPTRPAVAWPDGRGAEVAGVFRDLGPAVHARLANPVTAGMAGTTLAWLARYEPDTLRDADHALHPKDWVRLRLTGEAASDPSDASGSLLYDLPADAWALDVAEAVGVPARLLPPLRPSAAVAGRLGRAAASQLGLRTGIPVATGAGDTPAALLGSGLGDGEAQLSIGTGAQVVVATDDPTPAADLGVHLYRRAEASGLYRLGAVQNAGLALDWAARTLGRTREAMIASLHAVPPGADGVVFLPYLTGERTPLLDADARGGWSGLSLRHGPDTLARAVLEGIAFAVADALDAVLQATPGERALRLVGGGSGDPAWRQLLADATGAALVPTEAPDASARGAARLAARAIGGDLPAVAAIATEAVQPGDPDARFEAARRRFRGARDGRTSP